MKKLLNILSSITLVGTASTSIVACNLETQPIHDTRTDLNTLVIVKELGLISITNSIPTKEEVLIAIINSNPAIRNLSVRDFDFASNPTTTNATIIGTNNHKGKIDLFYEKDTRTDLNTLVTVKELGLISITNSIPTKEEVLIAIINSNPAIRNLSVRDFDFASNPTTTNATIIGINNHKGKIDLFYEKDTRTDLNKIISNKNLDWIYFIHDKPTNEELLVRIKEKNTSASSLSIDDFNSEIKSTTATITGKGKYSGKVILTYPESKSIDYIINNNDYFDRGDIFQYLIDKKYHNIYVWTWNRGFFIGKNGIFNPVQGWDKTSGEIINSGNILVDKDNNIYVGTATSKGKGKLFKVTVDDGKANLVQGWDENNGEVSFLEVDKDNNIYVGTAITRAKGKVFKVGVNDGKANLVQGWDENNGKVTQLLADKNNNVYVVSDIQDESTYKIKKRLIFLIANNVVNPIQGWDENNYEISYVTVNKNNDIYIKTTSGHSFKIINELNLIEEWVESNGSVYSLLADKNNNIYIKRKSSHQTNSLYKITNGKLSNVPGWFENNGKVICLLEPESFLQN